MTSNKSPKKHTTVTNPQLVVTPAGLALLSTLLGVVNKADYRYYPLG
jgi:hypothetical protein